MKTFSSNEDLLYSQIRDVIKESLLRIIDGDVIQSSTDTIVYAFYDLFIIQILNAYYESNPSKITENNFVEFIKLYILSKKYEQLSTNIIFINFLKHIHSELNKAKENLNLNLSEIKFIGDPHKNIFKFKHENHVYYSNILKVENFLNQFREDFPYFRDYIFDSSLQNGYVKRNFIEISKHTDIEAYYFNLGKVTPLVLALRLIDINHENILINSESLPHLFDIEFIFTPLYETVIKKYNLSISSLISLDNKDNASAILGGSGNIRSFTRPLLYFEKGLIKIKWVKEIKSQGHNLPPNLHKHPNEYRELLIAGFIESTSYISVNKNKFKKLIVSSNFHSRTLLRPTSVYRYALLMSAYGSLQGKSAHESISDGLSDFRAYDPGEIYVDKVFKAEISDLMDGLIPYFTVDINKTDIYGSNGEIVGKFKKSPINFELEWLDEFEKSMKKELITLKRFLTVDSKKHV